MAAKEVFERAARHGDEHVIKMTDTALDVAKWSAEGDEEGAAVAWTASSSAPIGLWPPRCALSS
ncbi:hypothetical protein SRIMM317S_04950 [Streptomyces rimosus subsp. rimosus]